MWVHDVKDDQRLRETTCWEGERNQKKQREVEEWISEGSKDKEGEKKETTQGEWERRRKQGQKETGNSWRGTKIRKQCKQRWLGEGEEARTEEIKQRGNREEGNENGKKTLETKNSQVHFHLNWCENNQIEIDLCFLKTFNQQFWHHRCCVLIFSRLNCFRPRRKKYFEILT